MLILLILEILDDDRHLKKYDFFDADNFPFIIFESSDIKKLENGKYIVTGFFTMRGVTKNITLHGKRIRIMNNENKVSAESSD